VGLVRYLKRNVYGRLLPEGLLSAINITVRISWIWISEEFGIYIRDFYAHIEWSYSFRNSL